MSLGSFIKKVGRAIDPTNAKSPLGGLLNSAIGSVVPGGSAILAGLGSAGRGKAAPAAAAPPPPPPPVTSSPAAATLADMFRKPTT